MEAKSSDGPITRRPTSLRAAQKEFTRQRILGAASSAFHERGYTATTIDDIVSDAGTTRATFYLHFKAKADLAIELLNAARAASAELYRELPPIVRDGRRRAFRAWIDSALDYWEQYGPSIAVVREAAVVEPAVRERVQRDRGVATDAIVAGLEEAGRYEPEIRPLRALLAWAQLAELFDHWLDAGWDFEREDVLDALTDGWLAALR
jgi:AcrR family transcriptional regulator